MGGEKVLSSLREEELTLLRRALPPAAKAAADFAAPTARLESRALSQLKIANRGSCSLPRVYEALAGIHRVLASMSGSYFQLANQQDVLVLRLQSADGTNRLSRECVLALTAVLHELAAKRQSLVITGNDKFSRRAQNSKRSRR